MVDLESRYDYDEPHQFSINLINSHLDQYNAFFYESGKKCFVEFKNEEGFNYFNIKYKDV